MQLTFLGTRGEIPICSREHRRHSALLIETGGARIMIDCGTDWLNRTGAIAPDAILLTHAHADHAAGLAHGAPCPVYMTAETAKRLARFPIEERRLLREEKPITLGKARFKAFPLYHSVRAPAVGFRISEARRALFYSPDVAAICDCHAALHRVDLYIGDGATPKRSMTRRKQGVLTGHAAIATQLDWCQAEGVRRAIFTHCGSQIVRQDPEHAAALVARLGADRGIDVSLAYDGLSLTF